MQKVQKLQNVIASRASQYNHEMKRKEREFNKLKERLNQLLVDKKEKKQGYICSGLTLYFLKLNTCVHSTEIFFFNLFVDFSTAIDVLNSIGRADGKRSLWKTEKTEAK